MSHKEKKLSTTRRPCHGQCKLKRILEGDTRSFPGNGSLTQYFQIGFTEGRILSDHRALIEEEKHCTFKELDEVSTKLALSIRHIAHADGVLINGNPDKDIVIGVCIPPSEKLIFSLFAILKLGAAYLPIDNSFPEDRVFQIVEATRPLMIISDPHGHTISKFDHVVKMTKVLSVDHLMTISEKEDPTTVVEPLPGQAILAERTAIIIFTSGGSQDSKGVRLSHRNAMNRLNWQWRTFPYTSHERCCLKTGFTFVDSVTEIFGPLLMGHSITIFGKIVSTHPNYLIQRIADDRITRVVLVPTLLRTILHTMELIGLTESRELLRSVQLWISSGETLSKDILHEFFDRFPPGAVVANFYGCTETMGDVTYETFASMKDVDEKSDESHIPIGRAVYNTIIYILDPDMKVVPEGETGEIYVAGYNVASGYVGSPNSVKFVENPYSATVGFHRLFRTGDFGRIMKPLSAIKTLFYEGRTDSQIKIRGIRVDLSEVEVVLHEKTELIDDAVVLCYHAGGLDQTLVAFVVARQDISAGQIQMMFKLKFRSYEMPELRLVNEIPLLVNGKVDRQRLLMAYEDERRLTTPYDDWHLLNIPEGSLKPTRAFVEVMSEVTGTAQHAIVHDLADSFFNLGGTSLNSVATIMKLRDKRYQIPITDFVAAKSILEIIAKMQPISANLNVTSVSNDAKKVYIHETLDAEHHDEVVGIIAYSFTHRGELEKYTHAKYPEYTKFVRSIWHELVERGCSFVIRRKDETKRIIAVSLNFDAYEEPDRDRMELSQSIKYIMELLDFVEEKHRNKLPKGKKKLFHPFLMGTHEDVDDSENVYVTIYMHEENIRVARNHGFIGILATNTSPLSQQICQEFQAYEILLKYPINQFEAQDGAKPFMLAKNNERAICCWKKVDHLGQRKTQHPDN